MPSMEHVGLSLFIAVLFLGVYATIFGLPGTLLIFCDALIYALFTGFHKIGFTVLLLLIVLTVLAETIGIIMDVNGRVKYIVSLKRILSSLIGAICGILALTPLFLGLGTLLGMFLGGFAGFFIAEMVRQSGLKPAFRTSARTLLATATGIVSKGFVAMVMTIIALTSIYS